MRIRLAQASELDALQEVFAAGRGIMRATGNHQQWTGGYPSDQQLLDDIAAQALYVCEDVSDGSVLGVFFFKVMDDPTYHVIDGQWLNEGAYGVIHRIASKGTRPGVGTHCILWGLEKALSQGATGGLRIDTHADNVPMRSLLGKLGFVECGIITIADGSPRVAYQRLS